jgi:L-rhamnose isomerase
VLFRQMVQEWVVQLLWMLVRDWVFFHYVVQEWGVQFSIFASVGVGAFASVVLGRGPWGLFN